MRRSLSILLSFVVLFSQQIVLSETQPTQQEGVAPSAQAGGQRDSSNQRAAYRQSATRQVDELRPKVQARTNRNLAEYNANNTLGWEYVNAVCAASNTTSGNTEIVSNDCAVAAIAEVNAECSLGAKYFKKSTRAWTVIGISMVIASAVFTGIGASSTLANAKVWSTLGGTTGLGAVTATVNSNVAGDQAALGKIGSTLDGFAKFLQSGGPDNKPASNELIWKISPVIAGQCAAAANGSGGNTPKS